MKRFSWFVVMAAVVALTVPALLTGCDLMRNLLFGGGGEDEQNPGGVTFAGEVTDLDLTTRIPAPFAGAVPVTSIGDDQSVQWTAAVAWYEGEGISFTGAFQSGKVYGAVVTLTAKNGYTFFEEHNFFHSGAANQFSVLTVPANGGSACVVTIVFPQTGSSVSLQTIQGGDLSHISIPAPTAGAVAATTVSAGSSAQYAATGISWGNADPAERPVSGGHGLHREADADGKIGLHLRC
jgi:hypothetical protein